MTESQPRGKHARHASTPEKGKRQGSAIAIPYGHSDAKAAEASLLGGSDETRFAQGASEEFPPRSSEGGSGADHASQLRGQYVQDVDTSAYQPDRYMSTKRRKGIVAKRVLLGALAVLVVYCVALGASAFMAYRAIDGIKGDATLLKGEIMAGDYVSARQSAQAVTSKIAKANGQLSSPLWAPTAAVPFVGKDITAARVMLDEASVVVEAMLVPMVESLAESDAGSFVREDGSLNADTIKIALQSVGNANASLSHADGRLSALKTCSIDQVDGLRRSMVRIIDAMDRLSFVAPQLANRIHWILGAEGESRSFLMLAQNNVEIRATGGYPGSLGPVYVSDGKLEMGDFVAVTTLGRFDMPWRPVADYAVEALPGTGEEIVLFGDRVVNIPGDFGYNPSFPRDSENWKHIWEVGGRGQVDGVVAIDPVFLQTLLEVFGGVTTSEGIQVDGSNAATVLMYDTYRTHDTNEAQDALFVEVAELAFDKMTSGLGSVDVLDFSKSVWRAGSHGRLKLWFIDSDAQYAFAHLGFAGVLSHDPEQPVLGVFYNDDSWSKMFWYFEPHSNIVGRTQHDDGSTSYRVKTTLTNRLTEDEQAALPDCVMGHSPWCDSSDDMVMWLYLFAPAGGYITDVEADGKFLGPEDIQGRVSRMEVVGSLSRAGMNEATYEGLDVWYCMTKLERGQTTTVSYTVTTSPDAQADLKMVFTPSALEVAGWQN